jgi:serine/threonine protein kinase
MRYSPLPLASCVALGRQLTDLVAAASEKEFSLRALSPSTLALTREPLQLKVSDISATASFHEEVALPKELFTKSYIAPELKASGGWWSPQADLYSLGVLLFEMLSGERLPTVDINALTKETYRILKKRRDIPAALSEVVSELLLATPKARPNPTTIRRTLG